MLNPNASPAPLAYNQLQELVKQQNHYATNANLGFSLPTLPQGLTSDKCLIWEGKPGLDLNRPALLSWRHPLNPDYEVQPIIRKGGNIMFYGPPKSRKTYAMDAMMTCFTTPGNPALNMGWIAGEYAYKDGWKGMRFDTEMPEEEVLERLQGFAGWTGMRSHIKDADTLKEIYPWYGLKGYPPDVCRSLIIDALEKAKKRDFFPSIIIIDQAVDLSFGYDQSHANEVIGFFNYINREYGCSIATTMHANRDGKEPSGSFGSHMMRKMDAVIHVCKQDDGTSKVTPKIMRKLKDDFYYIFAQTKKSPVLVYCDVIKQQFIPMSGLASDTVSKKQEFDPNTFY